MKKIYLFLTLQLILVVLSFSVKAQQTFEPGKLQVKWQIIENYYQHKNQFLSALTFTNTDMRPLPAQGWKLYFNFGRIVKPASVQGVFTIQHINGDFFILTPTAGFKDLASGDSVRVEFVSGDWVVNVSDAPSGFYLVWDDKPEQGIPLPPVQAIPSTQPKQYLRTASDKVELTTPEDIYHRNSSLKQIPGTYLPLVFPTPASYSETNHTFNWTADVPIVADAAFRKEAGLLAENMEQVLGKKARVYTSATGKAIRLKKIEGLGAEGYELKVTNSEITITASEPAGAFYGTQSLKTMLPPEALATKQKAVSIKGVEVKDAPRFGHRALLLDVARNFQEKKQVLKVLDLMALYKLNVLHFHFNDDEGWRIEIPPLPELTEVGGRRGHTLDNKNHLQPAYGSGPAVDQKPGSGYYTREDFIQILKYARERHIRVIPEIETPGHARAALKAMHTRYKRLLQQGKKQEAEKYLLRLPSDSSKYRTVQDWNDNIMDVALPSAYTFLETVVDELLAIYREADAPIETIHFGGDEVPAGAWAKSPAFQKLTQTNPAIKTTSDLWGYFYNQINQMLKKRNLYLTGWEEVAMLKTKVNGKKAHIPNPELSSENVHAEVWNNVPGWSSEDVAYRLANAGYNVILSNVTHLYFDMAPYKAFEEPGYYWGSYIDTEKTFGFIPYHYYQNMKTNQMGQPLASTFFADKERLTESGKKNIVGLQGALWGELITTPERQEYMLLPRLLALAERAWASDPVWTTETNNAKRETLYLQDYAEFAHVLGHRELPRLSFYNGGYGYRIPTPGVVIENGRVKANVEFPGFVIRYTLDGSEPTVKSKTYTQPIAAEGTIKLRAFDAVGRGGRTVTVGNSLNLDSWD